MPPNKWKIYNRNYARGLGTEWVLWPPSKKPWALVDPHGRVKFYRTHANAVYMFSFHTEYGVL